MDWKQHLLQFLQVIRNVGRFTYLQRLLYSWRGSNYLSFSSMIDLRSLSKDPKAVVSTKNSGLWLDCEIFGFKTMVLNWWCCFWEVMESFRHVGLPGQPRAIFAGLDGYRSAWFQPVLSALICWDITGLPPQREPQLPWISNETVSQNQYFFSEAASCQAFGLGNKKLMGI